MLTEQETFQAYTEWLPLYHEAKSYLANMTPKEIQDTKNDLIQKAKPWYWSSQKYHFANSALIVLKDVANW